jgi:isopentenyl diphosphate isomerase/L-lactate dehydrogenase-like FMN-dependent dehydrogenase
VLYDGGIRRGSDVATALALGARAVLVGRAWVFALAARGERGVLEILTVLRDGLATTVVALGHSDVAELRPDDVVLPPELSLTFDGGGTVT